MAKFAGEYYGASIDVMADKSRPFKSAVHKTMRQVKKARDANNHRNNDVYGANRANGLLFDVQSPEIKEGFHVTNPNLQEMNMVSVIDNKEQQENLSLMEWLNCRRYCLEPDRPVKDYYICENHNINHEQFMKLLDLYENKKITKRKIEALLEQGKLKEFLNG